MGGLINARFQKEPNGGVAVNLQDQTSKAIGHWVHIDGERGSSGTYVGQFTPDTMGEWQAIIYLDDGSGQVTKRYSVGTYDVTGVGVAVEGVDTKVDIIDSVVDGLDTQIDGMDTQLDTMEGKIDSIQGSVGSIDTPPMVS